MLAVERVLVHRVERQPSPSSLSSLVNFTQELSNLPEAKDHFLPHTPERMRMTILSGRECLLAYMASSSKDWRQEQANEDWYYAISEGMQSAPSFRDPITSDSEHIGIVGRGDSLYLAYMFYDPKLIDERVCAISGIKKQSDVSLKRHQPHVSLGQVSGRFGYFLKAARSLPGIEELDLERGRIMKNVSIKVKLLA